MKKQVIYTVLTGKYEELRQPMCIHPDFEYICFTDVLKDERNGVWLMREIPKVTQDKARLSRFPKMRPDLLLPDFEYSLYMDANLCIQNVDIYIRVLDLIKKNVLWAGVKHPLRDCVYEEAFEVLFGRRYEKKIRRGLREMKFLLKEGFPSHYGMYEANIIFRSHKNPVIEEQGLLWWQMLCSYSKRDQFALSYTLWKKKIPFYFLLPTDQNARNYPGIQYYNHSRFRSKLEYRLNRYWYIKLFPKAAPILRKIYYLLIGFK